MKTFFFYVMGLFLLTVVSIGCSEKDINPAEPLLEQRDADARFSGGILNMIEREISLTESQKQALAKLSQEISSEMAAKKSERKADMEALATAFKSNNLSDEQLEAILPQMPTYEKHLEMQNKLIQAHSILTSEQRKELALKLEQRESKRKEKLDKYLDQFRQNGSNTPNDFKSEKWKKNDRGRDKGSFFGFGFPLKMISNELNLTEDQEKQVAEIGETLKRNMGATKQVIVHPDTRILIEEFKKDKIDESVLNARFNEMKEKDVVFRSNIKEAVKSFHKILTPEQRQKASAKIADLATKETRFGVGHFKGKKHWGKAEEN